MSETQKNIEELVEEEVSLETDKDIIEDEFTDEDVSDTASTSSPVKTELKDTPDEYQLLQDTKNLRNAKSTLYVPKKQRYEDASSTAVIFCGFGILGDAIAILSFFHILNLPIAANTFSQVTMFMMFTIFFIIGVNAWHKASQLKGQLDQEDDDNAAINQWLKENIVTEQLDQVVDASEADEVNYLHKLDYLKEQLAFQFPNADTEFLELLADQFLTQTYEEN